MSNTLELRHYKHLMTQTVYQYQSALKIPFDFNINKLPSINKSREFKICRCLSFVYIYSLSFVYIYRDKISCKINAEIYFQGSPTFSATTPEPPNNRLANHLTCATTVPITTFCATTFCGTTIGNIIF